MHFRKIILLSLILGGGLCGFAGSKEKSQNLNNNSIRNCHAEFCYKILTDSNDSEIDDIVQSNCADNSIQYRNFYVTLAKEIKDSIPAGIIIPLHRNFSSWSPSNSFMGDPWNCQNVKIFGIPHYNSFNLREKGIYLLMGADNAACFSDDELHALLSQKIILDGAAAKEISDRGFSYLLGVNVEEEIFQFYGEQNIENEKIYPIDPSTKKKFISLRDPMTKVLSQFYSQNSTGDKEYIAPGTTLLAQNIYGGTVCVSATDINNDSALRLGMRNNYLYDVLNQLNGKQLPYSINNPQNLIVLTRTLKNSDILMGLFNLGTTDSSPLEIYCATTPYQIEILQENGCWEFLPFRIQNRSVFLNIECLGCAVLRIKTKLSK